MTATGFLRTKFICIIWTGGELGDGSLSSWGLSLFVLFELCSVCKTQKESSWGLSLFVLFGAFSGKNSYGSS